MSSANSNCGCTRRQAIRSLVGGSLLLPGIVWELLAADAARGGALDPLAPRPSHFPARAKRVIFLYMSGGLSHVDSFDPKPGLFADDGRKLPQGFVKRPSWEFSPYGRSGTEVSDLFPAIAECVDDLAVIRAMRGDHGNHFEATLGIHTGSVTVPRPSLGSWVSYGLGTVNQNLPAFVVLAPFLPYAGEQVWSSDFLPGCHQGTRVTPGADPIPNVKPQPGTAELQELELGLMQSMNRRHLRSRADDPLLAARIRSFETAFGMQMAAPEAFDLSAESDATHALYGLTRGARLGFAWQCLVARRLIERGVRFIELIDSGSNRNWDSHADMNAHWPLSRNVDQPIAGLLKDLKQRGLLDDTLVVWTTEFGRTPCVEKPEFKGREHHCLAFSSWLAGGGVKGGIVYGASDEYGINVAENQVHVHDFHATILHLLGLDHERLTYRHGGRDFRLTDVAGKVVTGVLA
ncbi:MAG TPA: DUF1501 domain-containing protein [Verrucomicrobiae bacterium]|nr:DUF1501 domain-containing protein [Verrucomicrobiae bacterium]